METKVNGVVTKAATPPENPAIHIFYLFVKSLNGLVGLTESQITL